jgi:hypothetical protein
MTVNDELGMIWKKMTIAYPRICLEGLTKSQETSVRTPDVPAEIRTEHLPSTSPERNRYNNLLVTVSFKSLAIEVPSVQCYSNPPVTLQDEIARNEMCYTERQEICVRVHCILRK